MNTCLSVIYLKLSKIDSRMIRFAILALTVALSGGAILHLPITGDVTG